MREIIGFFGGTFDPFHQAHAQLALAFCEQYHLTQLYLTPTAQPYHRAEPSSSGAHRLAMLQLACKALQTQTPTQLIAYDQEIKTQARGYTVETLTLLRQRIGATAPLFMLIGADSLANLHTWKNHTQLLKLAHIVVAARPDTDLSQDLNPDIAELWRTKFSATSSLFVENSLKLAACGTMSRLTAPLLTLSASKIRQYLGQPFALSPISPTDSAFLDSALEPSVRAYIHTHKLYTPC